MCFFPLIGAAVGLALWGWLALCDALKAGALLRGAAAALIPLLVTGGIHMDGFMDTLDALASWQPAEKRLEILKDTHVGAFAVIGCAGYLLLAAGVYAEATAADAGLLATAFVLSRAMSAAALTFFRSARPNGMLDGFARTAQRRMVGISAAVYAAVCMAAWLTRGVWMAALAAGTAVLCLWYYRRTAYRGFGGVTGDLAGWFVQITELALSAAIVLGGKWL